MSGPETGAAKTVSATAHPNVFDQVKNVLGNDPARAGLACPMPAGPFDGTSPPAPNTVCPGESLCATIPTVRPTFAEALRRRPSATAALLAL